MKVFLTGGTGFVGGEVIRQLLEAGHGVRALVRPGSEGKLAARGWEEAWPGDILDPASLEGALEGVDAVIHLVGIIREFPSRGITFERLHHQATKNIVAAAAARGVRRYLHMSSNGTREGAVSPYHITKWQAEEAVRASSLDWTIFRPSVIFGPDGEFVRMLAELVRTLPVVPVIGDGRYRMAPVSVADVAKSYVLALEKEEAVGKVYHCCGSESYSYDEILDLFGRALGKRRVRKLHHPLGLVEPVVTMMQSIPSFPITSSQLTMLLEGNICGENDWAEDFGISPQSFAEGIVEILSASD